MLNLRDAFYLRLQGFLSVLDWLLLLALHLCLLSLCIPESLLLLGHRTAACRVVQPVQHSHGAIVHIESLVVVVVCQGRWEQGQLKSTVRVDGIGLT